MRDCPHCGAPLGSLHDKNCPALQEPRPTSHTPAPTLSPKAQAVLEAAVAWRLEADEDGLTSREATTALLKLRDALDAYEATQKPKDYAPDELEPGTRFRFASGGSEGVVVQMYGHTWRYWLDTSGSLHKFRDDQRLIPLPEQDG